MEQAPEWMGAMLGLSSVGFYVFLAVWVGTTIWSRTQEKLAVQQTLRKLIDSGTALTPEVIEALRRPQPKRPPGEVLARAAKYRYWGLFLVVLGGVISLWGFREAGSLEEGLRALGGPGFVFFVIPGLFCLAHGLILRAAQPAPQE